MADGAITSNAVPNKQPSSLGAGKGKKMPAGKGRYTIGGKGTHGCSGFPVVGGEGAVHGCHPTRAAAMRQQAAIYASENQASKAELILELAKAQEIIDQISISFVVEDVEKSMDEEVDVEDDTKEEEEVVKRDYSPEQRRNMARRGQAMPDGSFPIADRADLQNAIQSVGRASNYEAAKRHIVSRARALGAMDMLPEDWNANKGLKSIFEKSEMPLQSKRVNTMGNKTTSFDVFKRQ